MAERIFFMTCLFAVIMMTVGADVGSIADITKRMEYLESKMELMENKHNRELKKVEDKTELREAELREKSEQLEARLNALEDENSALVKTNDLLRIKQSKHLHLKRNMTKETYRHVTQNVSRQAVNAETQKTSKRTHTRNVNMAERRMIKPRQVTPSKFDVAFTAFMDHDADAIVHGQTLVFNQVLLNDGGGYNTNTGVFIVPTTGVYFFTYFTGQRDDHQLWTGLYVNNSDMVNAVVQTDNPVENAQGGNSAVLKLFAGDAVYVKVYTGLHAEGSNKYRLTAFSGFLLYPL